jgi:hypothetical protein
MHQFFVQDTIAFAVMSKYSNENFNIQNCIAVFSALL